MAYEQQPPLDSAHNRPFDDYFSHDSIVRELCKERARKAKQRNDALFFHRIADDKRYSRIVAPPVPCSAAIYSIFPPRKLWHDYRPKNRKGMTSVALNARALFAAVKTLRSKEPRQAWADRLDEFVEGIRQRVLHSDRFVFQSPRIVPVLKDEQKKTYRPLAVFQDLADKIVDCLVARYLREALDSALLPSCWAFRCRQGKNHRRRFTTH